MFALVLAGLALVGWWYLRTPGVRSSIMDRLSRAHYTDRFRHFDTEFLGVPLIQIPLDLWELQEIISETRPDFVIETGTWKGGSALFFATVLEQLGDGKVITVDIEPQVEEASRHPVFQERVEVVTGDSAAPDVVARIAERVGDGTAMVTLDSLHTREHVAKELELYAPLVSVGSYLVVQDTTYYPGVEEAVREFLARRDDFVVDRRRERYVFTKYRGGFLRKIGDGG